ncbi:MAG: hypothetical protein KJ592_01225 [Nanoarchaeota archaeon]|nr:hypothetical protein [Nanoarchaeota archaeon]
MRKIRTQAEVNRKNKRNQIVVGVVLVGLLLVSTLGYSLMSSDEDKSSSVSELGIDFVKIDGIWKAVIDGGVFGFRNLPSEVSDIDVNVSADLGLYSGKVLYFINPGTGASEVLNNLGGYILRYQESCLRQDSGSSVVGGRWSEDASNGTECGGDLPVKSCYDNVIIFEGGNESLVYQDDNCVYVVGDSVKATDAFLYKVLGVY